MPVSGRRRFNIISPGIEEALGQQSVEQVRQEYQGRILPDSDARVRQVKRVLERLLPYAEGEGLKGILPLCRDEDGIAAVLGHEIAHVVAHHTALVFMFPSLECLEGVLTGI